MIFLILWAALVAANGDCPVKPEGFREGQLFRIDPGPASSRVVFGLAGEISKEKARLFANARAVGYVYIQHSRELEGVLHRLGRLDADVLLAWPAQEENVVLSGTESSPCRSPGLVVAPVRDFLAGNILSINRTCSTARIFDSGTVYCQAYHYQLHQGWKRMEEARLKRMSIAGSSWAEVAAVVTSSFRGFLNVPGWFDDVKPLSLSGSNWLGGRATLWDSISTLLIAADEDSYAMAREKALSEGVPCSILPTHVFEYHIRVLGGLLGAYSLSGDPLWLQGAKVAAEMMLQGPFSPFVLPLRRAPIVPPMTLLAMALSAWEGLDRKPVGKSTYRINSLAGVGTYALEFEALSRETGDMRYSETASQIHRILAKVAGKQPTLVRYTGLDVGWPPVQGCDSESGPLGAGADSFYEYLLKVPLLLQKNANREGLDKISQHRLAWFQRILPSIYSQIEKSSGLPTESCRPTEVCTRKFAHLLCFLPGLLAISENATAMESAKGMARALIRLAWPFCGVLQVKMSGVQLL